MVSGKHGFGLPKTFRFMSLEGSFSEKFTISYRDSKVDASIVSVHHRNDELLKIAVGQFCALRIVPNGRVALDLNSTPFFGIIVNKHGHTAAMADR